MNIYPKISQFKWISIWIFSIRVELNIRKISKNAIQVESIRINSNRFESIRINSNQFESIRINSNRFESNAIPVGSLVPILATWWRWFQYLEKRTSTAQNHLKQTYSWSEFNAEHDAIIIKFSSKTCHQVALISILRKRHFYCSEPFETNIFLIRISRWARCDHNKI